MRLAEFIKNNKQDIVAEWEAFAATLPPAARGGMTSTALRDHAPEILDAVAADLITPQTRVEQRDKSKGWAPEAENAPETAAQVHAVLRARSGFDINELVAEYRALRASVLRLWMDATTTGEPEVEEIIRFGEAIDQAIAESVAHFDAEVQQARNLFLGMLGHDMRTPLTSIVMTASYLSALNDGEVSTAAERLMHSGASIQALLDDLVDFNRTTLGLGIEIAPADTDLAAEVAVELEQVRGAHPGRLIELAVTGDVAGRWDGARLKQVLRNLVSNALVHGTPGTPVHVALWGEEAAVRLEVTNSGDIADPATLISDPLRQRPTMNSSHEGSGGLGLGLYIAREIVDAHGGKIAVRCEGGQTAFTVQLPRRATTG